MSLKVVAIYDTVAQSYQRPIFVEHVAHALRSFMEEVRRPTNQDGSSNQLHAHAGDFELWLVGEFDQATGAFEDSRGRLVRGADVPKEV